MLLNKIIIILLVLCSISNAYAWDSESGLTEDELFDIMFNSPYLYQDINNPKWYDPITNVADDWLVKFEGYFKHTPPNIDVQITIKKLIWDGSTYIEDTEFYDLDKTTYHQFKANTTQTIQVPILKSMEKVFKNNSNQFEDDNFKTIDIDPDYPDLLNITIDINSDGESLDFNNYGYYAFTDNSLDGIESTIKTIDYGFGDGKGAGGGSGSIYEELNIGVVAGGDTTGMGDLFEILFWSLIPLIFILSVIKMVGKIL
jgi:hypothetical protein